MGIFSYLIRGVIGFIIFLIYIIYKLAKYIAKKLKINYKAFVGISLKEKDHMPFLKFADFVATENLMMANEEILDIKPEYWTTVANYLDYKGLVEAARKLRNGADVSRGRLFDLRVNQREPAVPAEDNHAVDNH